MDPKMCIEKNDSETANEQKSPTAEFHCVFCENNVEADVDNIKIASVAPLISLNVDCLEELFEWLPLKDLLVLRQTCKRFKRVANYYIRTYYPSVKILSGKLEICDEKFDENRYKIDVDFVKSNKTLIDFKTKFPFFNQIKVVDCSKDNITSSFLQILLTTCPNLNRLCIRKIYGTILASDSNEWLLCKYPQLTHIILDDWCIHGHFGKTIIELKEFFMSNPNIRNLSMSLRLLWENRTWLIESNLSFDELHLHGYCIGSQFNEICQLINELYTQGFYKRLHFYGIFIGEKRVLDLIFSLNALEKLHLSELSVNLVLPPSTEFKELSFGFDSDIMNLEAFAENLSNIERIYFRFADFNTILTFIRHSPRLREIIVNQLYQRDGKYFKDDIIDVAALNKERSQLFYKRKVTVYVNEKIFLATKYATNNTNYDLVAVKRLVALRNPIVSPCLW